MAALLNRWIGGALLVIGAGVLAVGVYLGLFAWLNDGPWAGAGVAGTSGAFAAALVLTGITLRMAAAAHTRRDRRRWWIQAAVVPVAYVALGLAAEASSLLDRLARR